MSEEKYEGDFWSEDLETYKVDGRWEHRFTVDGMEVKMGTPDRGHFDWSHEAYGFHMSGGVWYGDEERLPGEVEFTVEWKDVDDEKVEEAEKESKDAYDRYDRLHDIWEKLDKDEDADEDDVTYAWCRMDDAEKDWYQAEENLEEAKEGEWMDESIKVSGGYVDTEIPDFDDWEPIFAVAAGLREMCYKIYSEGREHKGEVIA